MKKKVRGPVPVVLNKSPLFRRTPPKTTRVDNLKDWKKVVKKILPFLKPRTIICLSGPLGAGKTTFVQALAKTLGVKTTPRSPTFSLVRSHKLSAISPANRIPLTRDYKLSRLVHVDAYRIEDEKDLLPLDLDAEIAESGTIMALEWPERIKTWLKKHKNQCLWITIKLKKNGERWVFVA